MHWLISLLNSEVTKINNKLTAREKRFCISFANTGSCVEAAKSAGFPKDFEQCGNELLCRQDIVEYIEQFTAKKEKSLANVACAGYRRLAFGNIADAVSLLYMENPSRSLLNDMDLFMVSEIKRPKDGSMEIKFFDRLKALEKLEGRKSGKNDAEKLFEVIDESAKLGGSDKTEA